MAKEQLWSRANLHLLAVKNNGVVPDIPPSKAAKQLKKFIKSSEGEEARQTLDLSENYCFIGSRPVTDDPSKLKIYYLGPEGLRKTPPVDLRTILEGQFKPDFENDKRAKAKHAVEAFLDSIEGRHQARELVPTLIKRLKLIAGSQITASETVNLDMESQVKLMV